MFTTTIHCHGFCERGSEGNLRALLSFLFGVQLLNIVTEVGLAVSGSLFPDKSSIWLIEGNLLLTFGCIVS